MQANIARMRRFRFRFRHFEMFLCQLGELQSKESPGCLMNLEEKDDQRVGVCPLRHLLKEQGSASAQGDAYSCGNHPSPQQEERTCSDGKSCQSFCHVPLPKWSFSAHWHIGCDIHFRPFNARSIKFTPGSLFWV